MKPIPHPPFDDVVRYFNEHDLNDAALEQAKELTRRKGYVHWDEVRRQQFPDGVTAADVWFAIKLFRSPYAKINLFTSGTAPADSCSYVQTPAMMRKLHELDCGMSTGLMPLPRNVFTDERRDSCIFRSLVEESITSSQLEGAATTREIAREMIRQKRSPKDSSERMILNNYRAMEFIRKSMPGELTPEAVRAVHACVSAGLLDKTDASGRFRRSDEPVRVVSGEDEILHVPPPAVELEQRVTNMCRFANADWEPFIHPVIKAIILHFWLAYDHPFVDGNGRTARALFYWAMLKAGYEIFEFISISDSILKAPTKYGRAFLYAESDVERTAGKDLTYFIEHQLRVIDSSVASFRAYVERQMERQEQFKDQLRADMRFNHRQQALLIHAIKHPGYVYTIKGHQNSHMVTNMTARHDLLDLDRMGILIRRKIGKSFQFVVPADVADRVRAAV